MSFPEAEAFGSSGFLDLGISCLEVEALGWSSLLPFNGFRSGNSSFEPKLGYAVDSSKFIVSSGELGLIWFLETLTSNGKSDW